MSNYLSDMIYELTSPYIRKDYDNRKKELPLETNIGKLFSILAWGLDSVQEQTEMVRLWDDIDYAKGSVLDRYGANFGVERISPDDRYYRLAIKVKVMAQLSGGDINTVIWAASSLLEVNPSDVLLKEIYPAKIFLYVDMKLLSPELLEMIFEIAAAIKRIIAAGVGFRIYLRTYRTFRSELLIKRFSYINLHALGMPAIQSKINKLSLKLSQTAVRLSKMEGGPPIVDMHHMNHQAGFQGVYYSTRIKPKRIN